MQEYIDSTIILTEARMMAADYHCKFILVEGDSDKKFFSILWKSEDVFFRQVNGWENVYRLITYANSHSQSGIIGIIDRDYHSLLNDDVMKTPNIVFTDENDIEMMLFLSPSFDKFLAACGSEMKLKRIPNKRLPILASASCIGALRLVSAQYNYSLCFEDIEIKDLIDKNTLEMNFVQMINKILARTCSKRKCNIEVDKEKLNEKLVDIVKTHDFKDICSGHDVFDIICIAMTKLFASYNANKFDSDMVFSHLLMGYSPEEFTRSRMYMQCQSLIS